MHFLCQKNHQLSNFIDFINIFLNKGGGQKKKEGSKGMALPP